MSAHVLLPLAIKSESERKVNSLTLMGLEPATFDLITRPNPPHNKLLSPPSRLPFEHAHSSISAYLNYGIDFFLPSNSSSLSYGVRQLGIERFRQTQ
jgi:hypothetical protein